MAVTASDLGRELHELIAALDHRARRAEQAGEDAIARDAALREQAVHRLKELEAESHVVTPRQTAIVPS